MQNGYFKWAQSARRYNIQRFVRRVPYGTGLIKGDCHGQSDEIDIFIQ
jgi:hypothetical protein